MSIPYGPDGSVLPAMVRLQRKDKLCWAVIKFVPSPAELAPDGVVWRSPGKCFSVESFGEKKDGGIADWSRFVGSLPDDECRIGLFRFDFRAVRKFVLLSWSPTSTKIALYDDTKIWDIRKQVLPHEPATVSLMLSLTRAVSCQALAEGIDPKRVEDAEKGQNPRSALIALLLELTVEEKIRGIYNRGFLTLAEFLDNQPKVNIAECCTLTSHSGCAECVQDAKQTLQQEAQAAAAEVARAEAHLAARKARQLAEAYATGFYYRRITHERKVREAEAAAAAKRDREEREAEEQRERQRLADEARKRREYGAKAERDPVWRERLAAAKKGQREDLARWHHEHSLVAPSDPDILHKGVRRVRVEQASSLVRGEASIDLREAALKPYQKLLPKAKAARSAVYDPPSTAPDWSAFREVKFTQPGTLGLRLEEDPYGIVTVSALLSEERWEHASGTTQYDDGVAKATGMVRVGDRVVKVAAGEPGVTPESQIVEFAGYKVRLTVILGVLARKIRPITFTFGPPIFGGYPPEEEGGPRPVTPVEWGAPPAPLPPCPGEVSQRGLSEASVERRLRDAVPDELSAIAPAGDDETSEDDTDYENTLGIRKGAPTVGRGSDERPAIGIRMPMARRD